MNDVKLYDMIFKRKSFHIFKNVAGNINSDELDKITASFKNVKPLIEDINYDIKLVKTSDTTCTRGCEYCILFYSEKKDNYLQNIGYIGEQLDLYLASLDIGSLWFGIGRPKNKFSNLEYVIMIGIAKMNSTDFRHDMYKSKRKTLEEIWHGDRLTDIGNICRFAPSACNTQPWIVESNGNKLDLYRYKMPGKRGIMPIDKVTYYNKIDIGIFMLFLDLCLNKNNIAYNRELFTDNYSDDRKLVLNATYHL